MISTISDYSQSILTQLFAPATVAEQDTGASAARSRQADAPGVTRDVVEISPEAQRLLEAEQAKDAALEERISYYEQFWPAREGFSARNLAHGIADPSAQPFSQERPFADVATAARENLDAKYAAMQESGEPYARNSDEGIDTYSLFGDLDRRALYAVASNEGGQFTEQEQSDARDLMGGQMGMAIGLYNGPTRLMGDYEGGVIVDDVEKGKLAFDFLDNVSAEEKANDIQWAYGRAVEQRMYDLAVEARGGEREENDSGHPLVELIRKAFESWEDHPDWRQRGTIEDADDLRRQEWFAQFADQLDGAIAEARELYGVEA